MAGLAPHDEPKAGSRRAAERHRRPRFGFHSIGRFGGHRPAIA
jgi:hypothetical protein